MRIIGISVLEFRRTLDGKSWNPSFRWNERRAPLLLLHAENGQTGLGEAWSHQNAMIVLSRYALLSNASSSRPIMASV